MVARIAVKDASTWQPIAKIYVETHELTEGDQFAVWHFLTWTQSIADKYEKEFGRDGRKLNGAEHYAEYSRVNAKKDTRYPDAFALIMR